MNKFSSENLYIVVDGHHFVLLMKNEDLYADHLIAFKKVDYDVTKFASEKSAKPSRTFDRMGIARAPYSSINLTQKSDINFLKEACKVIDVEFKRRRFSRITLIGDYEILTIMKKNMSKNMLGKVFCEIYKNYSKLPLEALEKYLHSFESAH